MPMRNSEFAYKQDHPFEKRVAEAARIREKYPDRIPVICEKDVGSDIPAVDKRKYLIPMDLTVGQFVYVIRKRISIPSDKAIFIFVNNSLPPTAALMSTVYEQHKDQDGFMCALGNPYSSARVHADPPHSGHPRSRSVQAHARATHPARRYMMYSGENTFGSVAELLEEDLA